MTKRWRVGSCFSGGGLMDLAFEQEGFTVAWQAEIDAAANMVLAHHWPEVQNYGDITKIDTRVLEPVDVVAGGSPCFAAGTLVLTQRGLIPIEVVLVGDQVLTHKLHWRPVIETMRRKSPTMTVKGMGHHGLRTTADHPFWARQSGRQWRNNPRGYDRVWDEPAWVAANDFIHPQITQVIGRGHPLRGYTLD